MTLNSTKIYSHFAYILFFIITALSHTSAAASAEMGASDTSNKITCRRDEIAEIVEFLNGINGFSATFKQITTKQSGRPNTQTGYIAMKMDKKNKPQRNIINIHYREPREIIISINGSIATVHDVAKNEKNRVKVRRRHRFYDNIFSNLSIKNIDLCQTGGYGVFINLKYGSDARSIMLKLSRKPWNLQEIIVKSKERDAMTLQLSNQIYE